MMSNLQLQNDLERLISIMPPKIVSALNVDGLQDVIEIVLDIIGVFNVKMNVKFLVYLDKEKDSSSNPDREEYPDLCTYFIHHSNYIIIEKSIVRYE